MTKSHTAFVKMNPEIELEFRFTGTWTRTDHGSGTPSFHELTETRLDGCLVEGTPVNLDALAAEGPEGEKLANKLGKIAYSTLDHFEYDEWEHDV